MRDGEGRDRVDRVCASSRRHSIVERRDREDMRTDNVRDVQQRSGTYFGKRREHDRHLDHCRYDGDRRDAAVNATTNETGQSRI